MKGQQKRYSQAFKLQVIRELEEEKLASAWAAKQRYGVAYATVRRWLQEYGNDHHIRKALRVQTPDEVDEVKRLKQRIRQLESALADATIDLALERAATEIACERAGIEDVEGFKKKHAGKGPIGELPKGSK